VGKKLEEIEVGVFVHLGFGVLDTLGVNNCACIIRRICYENRDETVWKEKKNRLKISRVN
jgi:hypothetical protein